MAQIVTTSLPFVAEGTTYANAGYQPEPGHLGNLSIPQQHALGKLKKELQKTEKEEDGFILDEERSDDSTLLRYVVSNPSYSKRKKERKKSILMLCVL